MSKLANMRNANKKNDGDGGCVLTQSHSDVAMEKRLPGLGVRKKNRQDASPNGADNAVQKCGKCKSRFCTLEFLDCFVEIDDAVEECENLG